MANRRKRRLTKKDKNRIVLAVIASVVLLFSVFIEIAPKLNLPFKVPTWSDIFQTAQLTPNEKAVDEPFSVHFLDVGQGESTLVLSDELTMLIDSGEKENADFIVNYLASYGVKRLDYVVATHPHSDHIGAMADIINRVEVGTIYMPELPDSLVPTSKTFEKFLNAAEKSGAKLAFLKSGDEFSEGKVKVRCTAPLSTPTDLNNASLVLHVAYDKTSFLFTGDAESFSENAMLESRQSLSADVLSAGHHGSKTSTTERFLNAVNPKIAVISCGAKNSYGHPHDVVTKRLEDRNVQIFRTDKLGTIVIGSDGKSLTYSSEKGVEGSGI